MRYQSVSIESLGYQLPDQVVSTRQLETRLESLYRKLRIPMGQLEIMTGIENRRWWPENFIVSDGAITAANKALQKSQLDAKDLDALVYAGVCRDAFEPATACRVAAEIGVPAKAWVYDISNACLGVLNGMIEVANRIELGQIESGMVVACENSRPITELTIQQMLREANLDHFKFALATLTGGSGAVAVILTRKQNSVKKPELLGGSALNDASQHELCRWELKEHSSGQLEEIIRTDAAQVLKEGLVLGQKTWSVFLDELNWQRADEQIQHVVSHQVGKAHTSAILKALEIPSSLDFSSYKQLGNMGTVSLPLTLSLAAEASIYQDKDQIALLGIGSGLNCLMLGVRWQC